MDEGLAQGSGGRETDVAPAPRILVMMGVAGSGKSTVGRMLAEAIGARFIDGDDLHPEANVAKMSAGEPLTDEDRWPWLSALGETLVAEADAHGRAVGACSALKKRYREHIAEAAGEAVRFVHLNGAFETIAARMAARSGHFMPTSLLESQFATLEPPSPEEARIIDIGPSPEEIVARVLCDERLPTLR